MKWIEEAYYLRLPSGSPMQGDIWSNLPLPYSSPAVCIGILITPRCDLVHDKTPAANYLPLFTFEEFMASQGNFELLEQELQDAREALRRAAEPLRMREAVELELPTTPLLASLTASMEEKASEFGIPTSRLEKYVDAFSAAESRIENLKALLAQSRVTNSDVAPLCSSRLLMKYKLAVARNTIGDLHFLPPCQPLLDSACVVLLRRVATCSIEFLRLAQNCMSQRDWDLLRTQQATSDFHGAAVKPERLLRLKSPYLESLMFRFGSFFGRVGVRDIERRQLEAFVGPPEDL
jgi:hypothetical protein